MEVQKKKTSEGDGSPAGKNAKTQDHPPKIQDHLPKISWPAHTEDVVKTRWNPSALYF
jgi:hypothetical protein